MIPAHVLLRQVNDLESLYRVIHQLQEAVLDHYPHISCRTGCFTCCQAPSLPVVSSLEWAFLYPALLTWPGEDRRHLIKLVTAHVTRHAEILWSLHEVIQGAGTLEKAQELAALLPTLGQADCPFLEDGRCRIYPVRPLRCRAHGAFLIQIDRHVQFSACESEMLKLEAMLQQQGSRDVQMPVLNPYEAKLSELQAGTAVSTVIPLWLWAHVQDGELAPAAQWAPDFRLLRPH